MPNTKVAPNKASQKTGFSNGIEMSFPAKSLNAGSTKNATPTANKRDRKQIKPDSVKNCLMRSDLLEPRVFRTPTSLARFMDWAVDKFIKFTTANITKNKATKNKI